MSFRRRERNATWRATDLILTWSVETTVIGLFIRFVSVSFISTGYCDRPLCGERTVSLALVSLSLVPSRVFKHIYFGIHVRPPILNIFKMRDICSYYTYCRIPVKYHITTYLKIYYILERLLCALTSLEVTVKKSSYFEPEVISL